jgi:DUF1009 family protein
VGFANRWKMPPNSDQPKLGIIAGGGGLPLQVIQACLQNRRNFFVIALKDQTDPAVVAAIPHEWVSLGKSGKALKKLKEQNVSDLVMVGSVSRPTFSSIGLDLWTTKFLVKAGAAALGDDGLLGALVREIEKEGFRVVGVDEIMPSLLAPLGIYGKHKPDDQALADIRRGVEVARGIGALDVGQGAVVQEGLVLGVEAIEGTNRLLARCKDLKRKGPGGVLVKLKKPEQESRADLPTVGVETIKQAASAGLRGIAIEAGNTLVVDRENAIAEADKTGLFLIGIDLENET